MPRPSVTSVARDAKRVGRGLSNGARLAARRVQPSVGATPRTTIWRREKCEVARFDSVATVGPPVLLVHSLVSRSYILDLLPAMSFAATLRDAGFAVYLVDWGAADARDASNTLETYVGDYLRGAVDAVLADAGADQVSLVGYCLGAPLAALFAALRPDLVAGFVALAAPFDYSELGLMTELFSSGRFEPADLIDHTGNVPPAAIYRGLRMLRPTGDAALLANLVERLDDDVFVEGWVAINQWVKDHIPFPGAAFRQIVTMLFAENALMAGSMRLDGELLPLSRITCPVLSVIADLDHVVSPSASEPLMHLTGSADVAELRIHGGHASLVIGRQAATVVMPGVVEWLTCRSVPLAGSG